MYHPPFEHRSSQTYLALERDHNRTLTDSTQSQVLVMFLSSVGIVFITTAIYGMDLLRVERVPDTTSQMNTGRLSGETLTGEKTGHADELQLIDTGRRNAESNVTTRYTGNEGRRRSELESVLQDLCHNASF